MDFSKDRIIDNKYKAVQIPDSNKDGNGSIEGLQTDMSNLKIAEEFKVETEGEGIQSKIEMFLTKKVVE